MKPISHRLIVHLFIICFFLMRCILSGLQCDAVTITEIRLIIIIFCVIWRVLCFHGDSKICFRTFWKWNDSDDQHARRKRKINTEMFLFKEREEIECGEKIENICFEVYNYCCVNIPYPSRKFRVVPIYIVFLLSVRTNIKYISSLHVSHWI